MELGQRFLSFELTDQCNNACAHCYNFWRRNGVSHCDANGEPLTRTEIREILKRVKEDTPLEVVAFSGGEPLLRKDLPEIVADTITLGLEPVIVTNGVLLTEAMLRRLPPGIHFEVTLLGHTAELHDRLAGARVFDRVIANVARIERFRSDLTMVFVAMKDNACHAWETAELCLALGATALMYNRINLSGACRSHAWHLVPSLPALGESLHQMQEIVRQYKIATVCSVPIPPCIIDLSNYPDLNFGWCPRGGEHAYYTVGVTGLLRPCNHASEVLGNLRGEGFAEIVSRETANRYWEGIPLQCSGCDHSLKEQCMGGCRAAAFEWYGPPLRPDPIIELARGIAGL
jgi:radical SAM protein with 4Fe4S-binding SPASM domain